MFQLNDISAYILGAMLAIPGIYALWRGMHRDLEETNMRLQSDAYAIEIRRLQVIVDEQQRKINELGVYVASLKSKMSALGKALKRLTAQLKAQNIEPVVDGDKLLEILEAE